MQWPFFSRQRSTVPAPPTATTFVLSQRVIKTETELLKEVSFHRPLGKDKDINLAGSLAQHICPLETRKDSKQFILLVSNRHRSSQELRATTELLLSKNYRLAPGANVYLVESETIIHAVSRGHIDGTQGERLRNILGDRAKAGYYQSFEELVRYGVTNRASDIHLNIFTAQTRSEVRFTIEGKYVAPPRFHLPTATLLSIAGVAYQTAKGVKDPVFNGTVESQCRIFIDLAELGQFMLRWASMACDEGPQITMRITPINAKKEPLTLEQLGYLPTQIAMLMRAMRSEGGAIILSGVVDSGKSTTISTLLSGVPSTRKVMTVEDPRENILPGSHFHQNTVSRDLESDEDPFKPKKRTLKRTALNDLFIGEIRDQQTAALLQDAIESGTNCYTTVHARNCMGIPARLISPGIGIDIDVVSTPGNLKLMGYQALLPKNCPDCKLKATKLLRSEDAMEWEDYFSRIKRLYDIDPEGIYVRNPDGCDKCRRDGLPELNGLLGRTVVAELVEPDDYFLECIRDSKTIELSRYLASLRTAPYDDPDMTGKSAMDCAIYKMSKGEIDPREIEPRFMSFVTVERRREMAAVHTKNLQSINKLKAV